MIMANPGMDLSCRTVGWDVCSGVFVAAVGKNVVKPGRPSGVQGCTREVRQGNGKMFGWFNMNILTDIYIYINIYINIFINGPDG